MCRVIHGSCFDVLPRLPCRQVQAIFVDPPYNFGFDYGNGSHADRLPEAEYLARMEELIFQCVEKLTATGSIWFLIPECWADQIGTVLSKYLPRRNRIIWRETFGQYLESKFPGGHRHLFWHVKDPKETPFYTEEIRVVSQRMLDGDKRAAGPRVPDDVWEIPRLVGNAHGRIAGHPCQLPEELLERVIRCSTAEGDTVLDPMAGSGTTLRVAQQLGRDYIGIEEQAEYVQLITERLGRPVAAESFLRGDSLRSKAHGLSRCTQTEGYCSKEYPCQYWEDAASRQPGCGNTANPANVEALRPPRLAASGPD